MSLKLTITGKIQQNLIKNKEVILELGKLNIKGNFFILEICYIHKIYKKIQSYEVKT